LETELSTRQDCQHVCEQFLPRCVQDVLEAARQARPDAHISCLSFSTRKDGRNIAQMGIDPALIDEGDRSMLPSPFRARELLVLSVVLTETMFDRVQTVAHVLVARLLPRAIHES